MRGASLAAAPKHYTAQWNDDLHHVLHVAATHERTGYYADYEVGRTFSPRRSPRALRFKARSCRIGIRRAAASALMPPDAFVAFIQNHDHIGNRAFGERLGMIAPDDVMRALSAVYLLLPQIPMIFMGEEWDAQQPFPFFCDFDGELAKEVRRGARQEFAHFPEFADPKQRERIPDPLAEGTFNSAKLDWDRVDDCILPATKPCSTVRRREIVAVAEAHRAWRRGVVHGDGAVQVAMASWPG